MTVTSLAAILLVSVVLSITSLTPTDAVKLNDDCLKISLHQAELLIYYRLGQEKMQKLISDKTPEENVKKLACALMECEGMGGMDEIHKQSCSFKMACEVLRSKSNLVKLISWRHTPKKSLLKILVTLWCIFEVKV